MAPEDPAPSGATDRPPRRRLGRRVLLLGAGLTVAAIASALAAFQPWKLVVDDVVDEALPVSAASSPGPAPGGPTPSGAAPAPDSAASTPRVVARGELISHEHRTSGTVVILAFDDGRRVLRLQDLRTSNGPDVKVWLSDAPVRPGTDGWRVFDDGAYADLGRLKGNVGNQNYDVPADVDLATLSSVSLWCDRFDVSFGAAVLVPV
jgi:hypothetical protein